MQSAIRLGESDLAAQLKEVHLEEIKTYHADRVLERALPSEAPTVPSLRAERSCRSMAGAGADLVSERLIGQVSDITCSTCLDPIGTNGRIEIPDQLSVETIAMCRTCGKQYCEKCIETHLRVNPGKGCPECRGQKGFITFDLGMPRLKWSHGLIALLPGEVARDPVPVVVARRGNSPQAPAAVPAPIPVQAPIHDFTEVLGR